MLNSIHNLQLEKTAEEEKLLQLQKEFETFRHSTDTSDREKQLDEMISQLEQQSNVQYFIVTINLYLVTTKEFR
jgi:hypothetical protein